MQLKTVQPLWYQPTTVMLIDDDKKALKGLSNEIDPVFPFVAYTNPESAFEDLKKNMLPLETISQEMIKDAEPIDETQALLGETVNINFATFHANLDKPDRFTKHVTIVVDKVMDEMDGLEFCRLARKLGLPVKLILLTGNAGADEAVAAFNDHIIDAFVKKTTSDMMEQVNHHLRTLSSQAFCDAGIQLLGSVINKFSLLSDNIFFQFFKEICKKYNIVEYYILDSSCSYLLITADGEVKILLIRTEEDFKNAYDISEEMKDNDVLDNLKNLKSFPFTGTQSYFTSDTKQWKNNMISMEKHNDLDFYYAVADYKEEPVMSFNHYLKTLWKPQII